MLSLHWLSRLLAPRGGKSTGRTPRERTKERRLKLMRLEQRRVLNADFSFTPEVLKLSHIDGDLSVREVSSGLTSRIEFDLHGSVWQDDGSTGTFAIDNSTPCHSILSVAKHDLESLPAGASLSAASSAFDVQFDVHSTSLDLSHLHGTLVVEGFGTVQQTTSADHDVMKVADVSLSADQIHLSHFHGDDITLHANEIDLTGGHESFSGTTLSIFASATPTIELGGLSNGGAELNFTDDDITALDASFHQIRFEAHSAHDATSVHVDATGADFRHAFSVAAHDPAAPLDGLHLAADSVRIDGSLSISGGLIDVTATHDVTIADTGSLVSHGGHVHLDAGEHGTLLDSGDIDVSNSEPDGIGGTVHLLGRQVGLFDSAHIDASGDSHGGEVLIGGDLHGDNNSIPHAAQTFVGHDVAVHADALHAGDGGTIVVWSDDATQLYGSLTARGGVLLGDGGLIETSSLGQLILSGSGDASAANGHAGTWLLDPYNVTIRHTLSGSGVDDSGQLPNFTPTASGSEVTDTAIEAQLNAGTNVVISTVNPSGGDAGNVIQLEDAAINVVFTTSSGFTTLTINAANNIVLDGGITVANGTLDVALNANTVPDDPDLSAGNVEINAAINTNGGIFSSSGVNFDNTHGTITATGGITISQTGAAILGTISAGDEAITVTAGAGITDTGAISTTGQASFTTTQINTDISLDLLQLTGTLALKTTGPDGNATVVNATDIDFEATEIGGNLTVTATTGNITDSGSVIVGHNAQFTTNRINDGIDLDSLQLTGTLSLITSGSNGDASVVNATGIDFANTNVGGNLTAVATSGNITDSTALFVGGDSSFTTSQIDDDINLNLLQLSGTLSLTTFGVNGDATVVNGTGLDFAATAVGGRLTATASNGDITGNAGMVVGENAKFLAINGGIHIAAVGSIHFGSLTFVSGGDVSIAEDSETILSGLNTAINLNLLSSDALTNDGTANLAVENNAALSGATITLGDQAGDLMNFGTLTVNSVGAVTVIEDSATILGGIGTASSLNLRSSDTITDDGTANLTVENNALFNGTSITLDDVYQFGSLTFTSPGTVEITEADATVLHGTSIASDLNLRSNDSITNDPATNISIDNNASFHATSITLGQQSGDLLNFGTLTFDSTGEVSIAEDSETSLAGSSLAGSLALHSTEAIKNDGSANVVVEGNASFSGSSITLDDVYYLGSLTFQSPGDVEITEADSTELSSESSAVNLTLTSSGSIDDGADGTLIVTEITNLIANAGGVVLDNANDFQGLVTVNSGDFSALNDINSLTLSESNVAGQFTVSATDSLFIDGLINADSATMTSVNESISGSGKLTASTLDLSAAAGIYGATSDDLLSIAASTISAASSGDFDVKLSNENSSQTTVTALTTIGGNLEFAQSGGGAVIFDGPVTSGDLTAASPVAGGSITLTSTSGLTIAAAPQALSSEAGAGGTLSISGATIDRAIVVGEGNITIHGSGENLLISADISVNASVDLSAIQDVIITSTITVSGATSDLIITADSDFDGMGGFWLNEEPLTSDAQLIVDQDVTIFGASLVATGGNSDGIRIDGEGDAQQVIAGRDLVLSTTLSVGTSAGDIILDGRQTAGGSLTVSSDSMTFLGADQVAGIDLLIQSAVRLTNDVAISAGGSVTFGGTIDDDSVFVTGSALTVTAGGEVLFAGAIGADASDRLDTLTIVDAESVHFQGTVEIDGNIDITTTGVTTNAVGTVTFDKPVTTTAGLASGSVEITNFGRLIINPGADFVVNDSFIQNGTEATELGANITTLNGGVAFDRSIVLTESVTIDSSNQSGDLIFADPIDSEVASGVAEHNSLTLSSGLGVIAFNGDIGAGTEGDQRIGDFTIVTAGAVLFGGNDANEPSDPGTTGPMTTITTTGAIDIGVGGNVVAGGIVFNAESGLMFVKTTDDTVRFNGPVTLASDLDINTNGSGIGGTVTFTADSPIDSDTGQSFALTIDAGTQQVLFNNDLGLTDPLKSLTITQADAGVSFGQADANQGPGSIGPVLTVATDGAIDIGVGSHVISGGILLNAGNGTLLMTTANETIRFNGSVTLASDVEIDSNTGGGGGTVTFTSAATIDSQTGEHNDLTIDAGTQRVLFNNSLGQFNSLGAFTITQADDGVIFGESDNDQGPGTIGPVTVIATDDTIDIGVGQNIIAGGIVFNAGSGTLHLTTTDDSVRLNGPVTLATHLDINTNSSGSGTTSVASGGTVTFSSSATIDSQAGEYNDLTIDAGTEQVQFNNDLGKTQLLGALTIIQADGGVSFGQPVTVGQGDEDLSPGGTGPVKIVATDGPIDIGVGSNVITGGIVLNAGLDTLKITTTDDTVRFNGPVTLASNVDIDTNATEQGGTVTFTSAATIDSQPDEHNDLVIDVGTAQVLFNNDLGASQTLGALTITQADSGVIFGETDTDQGPGLTGPVTVIATDEPIDIGVGDHIIFGGIVLNAGSGTLTMTTTDDTIRFNGPILLSSDVSINTNVDQTPLVGGDTVTFTSASPIDSQPGEFNDLTIGAGVQQVLFNNDLGASQPLGALTITQADGGVTFGQADSDDGFGIGPVTTIATDGPIDIGVDAHAIVSAGVVLSTGITFNGGSGTLQITTTDDSVRLNGPVTLLSSVDINTNTTSFGFGGTVTFTSDATIDGEAGETNDLTIDAGTQQTLFNNDIGATNAIGALTITQADAGVIFGESDTNQGPGTFGPVTTIFTDGAIDIGVGSNVITGGIVLNSGTSTPLLSIATTDDSVRFNGAVSLNTDVSIDTNATPDSGGGTVIFTSSATIDSETGEHHDLTIDAGLESVLFNNDLGRTEALAALTVIQADGGVIFGETDTDQGPGTTGPVTVIATTHSTDAANDFAINIGVDEHVIAGGIVLNAGSGTLTITTTDSMARFNGPVSLLTSVDINTNPTGVGSGGTVTFTSSGSIDGQFGESNDLTIDVGMKQVLFNNNIGQANLIGKLTITRADQGVIFGESDIDLGAGLTGPVSIIATDDAIDIGVGETVILGDGIVFNAGTDTLFLTTTDDTVRINGAVTLNSFLDINTNPAGGGGNVTFTSDATIDSEGGEFNDLTLDVGTQQVLFNNNLGANQRLGALTITQADSGVTFGESDTNEGPGKTGPVATIATAGAVDIGVLDHVINGGILLNGDSGTLTLTTTDAPVRFNGQVTLASDVVIDTNENGFGGTVTFTSSGTIDSQAGERNDLTIDAGAQQVLFNNNLGEVEPLATLTIIQADAGITFGESDTDLGPGLTGPVSAVTVDGPIDLGVGDNVVTGGIVLNGGIGPGGDEVPITIVSLFDRIRVNGPVTALVDSVWRAAEGITLTNEADITTTDHNIEMFGDTNDTRQDDPLTDAIVMNFDTFIDAGNGYILMDAATIQLGSLISTNTGATVDDHPAIHVTATTGAIVDINSDVSSGSDYVNLTANAPGAGVVLDAVTGIGRDANTGIGDALETEVDTLQARNMDSRDSFGDPIPAIGNIQIVEVPTGGNLNLINFRNEANATSNADPNNGVIDVLIERDPQLGLPGFGAVDGNLTVLDDDLGGVDATNVPYGLLAQLKGDPALPVILGDRNGVESENIIRLTANNITINDDILAITDPAKGTSYETIEIHARGDFALAANRVISTDENFVNSLKPGDPSQAEMIDGDPSSVLPIKPRVTDDRVRIVADFDHQVHVDTGNVFLGRSSTISTDAGVEQLIARRPAPNEAGTAFFDSTTVVNSDLNSNGLDAGGSKYIGFMTLTIGKPGEKNLILDVDWGDTPRSRAQLDAIPFPLKDTIKDFNSVRESKISDSVGQSDRVRSDSNENPPIPQGTSYLFDPVVDKDKTRYFIPEGGLTYIIPHEYSSYALNLPAEFREPGRFRPSDPFQVRFSVSQHASINIQGRAIQEATIGPADSAPLAAVGSSSPIKPLALLSSTDILEDNLADDHGLPYTPTVVGGMPNSYQDEANFRLNSGVATFGIPTTKALFFIKVDPVITPPEAPRAAIPDSTNITAPQITTETTRGSASSSSVTTDEFFELHLVNEDGTITVERLKDGEGLLERERFESFVRERGDGDYEIWFITRETGTGARIERPVIQFRLEGGRLTPPSNDAQPLFKPFRLVPVPQPEPQPKPDADAADQDANGSAAAVPETDSNEFSRFWENETRAQTTILWEGESVREFAESQPEQSPEAISDSPVASIASMATGALVFSGARWRQNRLKKTGPSQFSLSARLARKRQVATDDH